MRSSVSLKTFLLLPDEVVRLVEDVPPLTVPDDDPVGPAVLDHSRRQLSSEGSLLRLVAVLGGHADGRAGQLVSHVLKVTAGHAHHHLSVGVEGSRHEPTAYLVYA